MLENKMLTAQTVFISETQSEHRALIESTLRRFQERNQPAMVVDDIIITPKGKFVISLKREAAYREYLQLRDELFAELATTKFIQARVGIPLTTGEIKQVKGPSIGGLVVHRSFDHQTCEFNGPKYVVTHILSGDRINMGAARPLALAMREGDAFAAVV